MLVSSAFRVATLSALVYLGSFNQSAAGREFVAELTRVGLILDARGWPRAVGDTRGDIDQLAPVLRP
jgi:hypothetical protein